MAIKIKYTCNSGRVNCIHRLQVIRELPCSLLNKASIIFSCGLGCNLYKSSEPRPYIGVLMFFAGVRRLCRLGYIWKSSQASARMWVRLARGAYLHPLTTAAGRVLIDYCCPALLYFHQCSQRGVQLKKLAMNL